MMNNFCEFSVFLEMTEFLFDNANKCDVQMTLINKEVREENKTVNIFRFAY